MEWITWLCLKLQRRYEQTAGRERETSRIGLLFQQAKSPAQVLIRWSLQKGLVPLPKSSSHSRIEENFKVFDFHLDEEDMAALDALDEGADGAVTWNPVDQR